MIDGTEENTKEKKRGKPSNKLKLKKNIESGREGRIFMRNHPYSYSSNKTKNFTDACFGYSIILLTEKKRTKGKKTEKKECRRGKKKKEKRKETKEEIGKAMRERGK